MVLSRGKGDQMKLKKKPLENFLDKAYILSSKFALDLEKADILNSASTLELIKANVLSS